MYGFATHVLCLSPTVSVPSRCVCVCVAGSCMCSGNSLVREKCHGDTLVNYPKKKKKECVRVIRGLCDKEENYCGFSSC